MNHSPIHPDLLQQLDGVRLDQLSSEQLEAFVAALNRDAEQSDDVQSPRDKHDRDKHDRDMNDDADGSDHLAKSNGSLKASVPSPVQLVEVAKRSAQFDLAVDRALRDPSAADSSLDFRARLKAACASPRSEKAIESCVAEANTDSQDADISIVSPSADRAATPDRKRIFAGRLRIAASLGLVLMLVAGSIGIGYAFVNWRRPPEVVSANQISQEIFGLGLPRWTSKAGKSCSRVKK